MELSKHYDIYQKLLILMVLTMTITRNHQVVSLVFCCRRIELTTYSLPLSASAKPVPNP